ncbi:Uracil phosphoribosyltransferase protein [Penicillium alfredii]|uniref:Uracil phosphoribosyltransferase protein n=1 Tax=Penicillium alfredii TaxID=1506179 RepID=A0A9W9G9L9_9EURO|nr:Uracil phosphoribosyltransferase protein [Penicillium alfredii]KAJ5114522.1 Uracil phosphoribosyltransferase protein [Penicillium alfredii]
MEDDPNTSPGTETVHASKPTIVGLYGISGTGKTFLLNDLRNLKETLGISNFFFYEGSQVIVDVCPGGLEEFQQMEDQDKAYWRQCAISRIHDDCTKSRRASVVAGHFMFWREGEDYGQLVCTPSDLDVYTHILYLDIPRREDCPKPGR